MSPPEQKAFPPAPLMMTILLDESDAHSWKTKTIKMSLHRIQYLTPEKPPSLKIVTLDLCDRRRDHYNYRWEIKSYDYHSYPVPTY